MLQLLTAFACKLFSQHSAIEHIEYDNIIWQYCASSLHLQCYRLCSLLQPCTMKSCSSSMSFWVSNGTRHQQRNEDLLRAQGLNVSNPIIHCVPNKGSNCNGTTKMVYPLRMGAENFHGALFCKHQFLQMPTSNHRLAESKIQMRFYFKILACQKYMFWVYKERSIEGRCRMTLATGHQWLHVCQPHLAGIDVHFWNAQHCLWHLMWKMGKCPIKWVPNFL